jgi:hypothetical protein
MFDTEAQRPAGRTEVRAQTLEKLYLAADEAAGALLGKR